MKEGVSEGGAPNKREREGRPVLDRRRRRRRQSSGMRMAEQQAARAGQVEG